MKQCAERLFISAGLTVTAFVLTPSSGAHAIDLGHILAGVSAQRTPQAPATEAAGKSSNQSPQIKKALPSYMGTEEANSRARWNPKKEKANAAPTPVVRPMFMGQRGGTSQGNLVSELGKINFGFRP